MKRAFWIVLFLAVCTCIFLLFLRQAEVRNYERKVNAYVSHLDSLRLTIDSLEVSFIKLQSTHVSDTLKLVQNYQAKINRLKRINNEYKKKIDSVDNITSDSAFRYLLERYGSSSSSSGN